MSSVTGAVAPAYDPAAWTGFFTTTGTSAAALTGLVFVAVSLNRDQITSAGHLPGRALEALNQLLIVTAVSFLALAPAQPPTLVGAEFLAVGLAGAAIPTHDQLRTRRLLSPEFRHRHRHQARLRVALTQLSITAFLIAAVSQLTGHGGGLYWTVPATLLAVTSSAANAWVLLIEIVR